jgi:hypothetical protein
MNDKASEIERAQKEYEHVTSELVRYDSDSQKLVSYISLILTAVFAIGVSKNVQPIFPFIPILTLVLVQYLVSNNFAYRVREQYVHDLENILKSNGTFSPSLYGTQIKKYYLGLKLYEHLVHPFSGAILFTIGLLFMISVYSIIKSKEYLLGMAPWGLTAFYSLLVVMVSYCSITIIYSVIKLGGNRTPANKALHSD